MERNLFIALAISLIWLSVWSALRPAPERPVELAESEAPAALAQPPLAGESKQNQGVERPGEGSAEAAPRVEERVRISTELFEAELTTRGGGIAHWQLKQYLDRTLDPPQRVDLTTHDPRSETALATPFRELGLGDLSRADFEVEQTGPLEVVFRREQGGVRVTKRYRFAADSYAFRLLLEVSNDSGRSVEPTFEVLWPVRPVERSDFREYSLVAYANAEIERTPVAKAGKSGFGSSFFGRDPPFVGEVDWAGADTRYFIAAIASERPSEASADFRSPVTELEPVAFTSLWQRPVEIISGQRADLELSLYLGPKVDDRLSAFGRSLHHAIDRGYTWAQPLAQAFSWLLRAAYSVVPNYGLAIILITVLVRLVTAPLTAKQMRSMKQISERMKEAKPRIDAVMEKYGDDKRRLQEEQMKIYRETGVNPFQMVSGGCLPMLLQFPVFIGLFYALQSTIDLRQAPFFLWINDLSQPEALFTIPMLDLPFRVLPLVMGLSMLLQQRLTPNTSMDPAQQRMMTTIMPIMFTFIFYQFASGLVLYWLVSNLLGIAQQMWLTRERTPAAA